MPCVMPLKAYRGPDGAIVFDSKRGFSDLPLELSCGQCIGCRVERARQWTLRCLHEAKSAGRGSFVTLTYDQGNVPAFASLRKRDFQLFMKRLRKRIGPVRFVACGEYGDESLRPHYHALLFGEDFSRDRRVFPFAAPGREQYLSPTLQSLWPLGMSVVQDLNPRNVAYVCRYVVKKVAKSRSAEAFTRHDSITGEVREVEPEFFRMSRRPGIGAAWFKRFSSDVFPSDECILEGRSVRVPAYYEKLQSERDSAMLESVKARRRRAVAARAEDLTPERLRAREEILLSRMRRRGSQ